MIATPTLITGMRMDRAEFLRRWEALPDLKQAELIDGIVHIPGPVGALHGTLTMSLSAWLGYYAMYTPGCEGGTNATWLMLDDSPQPSTHLRIPWHSSIRNDLFEGAPDLAVDVCETNTEVDFGPKLALYQSAGVKEYITLETLIKRVQWRILEQGTYRLIHPDSDGVIRSITFPGLWLDVAALWAHVPRALLASVERGVATPEHATFVKTTLANRE